MTVVDDLTPPVGRIRTSHPTRHQYELPYSSEKMPSQETSEGRTSVAAAIVRSMSDSVWMAETKLASN